MNAMTVLRSRVEQVAKQFQGLLLRKPKRGSTQTQVLALTFFKLLQHIKHLIILLIVFFFSLFFGLSSFEKADSDFRHDKSGCTNVSIFLHLT